MSRRSRDSRRRSWLHYDGQTLLLAAAIVVILYLLYFYFVPSLNLGEYSEIFLLSVIANLIPTLIVVIIGFLFYSAAQRDRQDEDREDLIDEIDSRITSNLAVELENIKRTLLSIQENQFSPIEFIEEIGTLKNQGHTGSSSISRARSNKDPHWHQGVPESKANSALSRDVEKLKNREAS